MSIFNARQTTLAVIILALVAFMPSLNGLEAPPIRLGSDAQPLSTACNCVNVISGQYFISEPNLVVDGPVPLSYSLAYDAGVRVDDGLAWGWHLQIPHIPRRTTVNRGLRLPGHHFRMH